jgi:23S rRNA U2552 (ribose-2'-O)-methylase RlmE/FtsJ
MTLDAAAPERAIESAPPAGGTSPPDVAARSTAAPDCAIESAPPGMAASARSMEVPAHRGGGADLITSDLSPKLTGIADRDQARSAELLTIALEFAAEVLKPGGAMIAKVFMGGEFEDLKRRFDRAFDKVEVTHTKATRPGSSELYLVARGFRPGG